MFRGLRDPELVLRIPIRRMRWLRWCGARRVVRPIRGSRECGLRRAIRRNVLGRATDREAGHIAGCGFRAEFGVAALAVSCRPIYSSKGARKEPICPLPGRLRKKGAELREG